MYLALAMSFAHVLALGPAFVGHPLTQAVWAAVWIATAGLVLCYRFALPIVRTVRHQLRVAEVRREGPGVVSVILTGRHLDKLPVSGGQFLSWRFLTPEMWWQAHPYSLSALPQPPYLRITVKAVGDHSGALAHMRPGTRVAIEGPYGAFTQDTQRQSRALLIAGGIGVTAMRSLLEDLPRHSAPVVIVRASRESDLVLRREIAELVRHHKGVLHEVIGSRDRVGLDERSLATVVPDIQQRDIFICGPEGFVAELVETVRYLGVSEESIHHEAFAL
jgi:ferredoxin-NADP reductase